MQMTALADLVSVIQALAASVAVLSTVALGIAFIRLALMPSDERLAASSSHIFQILGTLACIGALGTICIWVFQAVGGASNPFINRILSSFFSF
jgi:hypothetical protein